LPRRAPSRAFVPAATPARDTALALLAHPSPPVRAAIWLRAQALPGAGWPRQFAAELHSHTEETALALLALRRAQRGEPAPAAPLAWLRRQQGRNGGWAACDAGLEEPFRPALPFPGAYAAADPACPALTGLALEALVACGAGPDDEAVRRGVEFLTRAQLARDGSWTSRWGVHFLHGACFALRGLRASGFDDHDAVVLRAGEWIRSIQNADGGWGESPASLDRGEFVEAPSNATHTAWAVLGLLAGGDRASESVRRGVEYLFSTQNAGGGWAATALTMMHVPPSLFLTNALDAVVFPMLALREARS
jgi:squalene-hopene/tetraprenyl-beta-curcumene cyclase